MEWKVGHESQSACQRNPRCPGGSTIVRCRYRCYQRSCGIPVVESGERRITLGQAKGFLSPGEARTVRRTHRCALRNGPDLRHWAHDRRLCAPAFSAVSFLRGPARVHPRQGSTSGRQRDAGLPRVPRTRRTDTRPATGSPSTMRDACRAKSAAAPTMPRFAASHQKRGPRFTGSRTLGADIALCALDKRLRRSHRQADCRGVC
jgi:hypothetical protein